MNKQPVEILLVEDNPDDIELALQALKKNNLANHFEVVRDGQEALDFVFAAGNYARRVVGNGPKVILLDLKLPKVDGLEVLKQIKADPRTRMIPVVVLTSAVNREHCRNRALLARLKHFVNCHSLAILGERKL